MDRNAIIAIIVVVVVVIVAAIALAHPGQATAKDTEITFLNDTAHPGEEVYFELKDKQGNGLANQTVTIEYGPMKGNVSTDKQGQAYVALDNSDPGVKYNVTVSFNGTDQYKACTKTETISIIGDDSVSSSDSTTP